MLSYLFISFIYQKYLGNWALDASADQTIDELCTNGQHKVSELPLDLCLLRLVWVSNDWAVMTRSDPRKTW